MNKPLWALALAIFSLNVHAGVIDPDCTAQKAVKSSAMKATVGVGGRCSPKEAVADSVDLKDKKKAVSNTRDNAGDKVDGATDNLGRKTVKKAATH